jgi:cytochrome b
LNTRDAVSKIPVWDLPVRVFHWLLAISFAGAFLTAESEHWRSLHVMLGYTFFGLILFRLTWGFTGSRHARFSSFIAGLTTVRRYLRSMVSGNPEHHVGHNPAGALAILTLLGVGLATASTGWAVYNDVGGDWVEQLHEGAAYAMLAFVGLHVAGVVVSSIVHRENLVGAMITGRKPGTPDQAIRHRHHVLGVLLFVAVVAFWAAWILDLGVPAGRGSEMAGLSAPGHAARGAAGRHRDHDD